MRSRFIGKRKPRRGRLKLLRSWIKRLKQRGSIYDCWFSYEAYFTVHTRTKTGLLCDRQWSGSATCLSVCLSVDRHRRCVYLTSSYKQAAVTPCAAAETTRNIFTLQGYVIWLVAVDLSTVSSLTLNHSHNDVAANIRVNPLTPTIAIWVQP